MELDLESTEAGWILAVRVQPKGGSDRIVGVHNGALKVSVTAAPEKGKANAAVCRLLASVLGQPVSAFEVVRGETSRDKRIRIPGDWTAETLRAALLGEG